MIAIKNAAERGGSFDQDIIPPTYPDDSSAFTPLSFRDYVTALRAKRVCLFGDNSFSETISGLQGSSYNWMVPLVKCDSRECQSDGESAIPYCEFSIIALAGINGGEVRAEVFKGWVETKYPAIVDPDEMPFDFPLIQMFEDPQAMDDYIKDRSYGGINKPKIAMGIVFDGSTPGAWNYWLRQNSTNFNAPEQEGRPATRTTPDTSVVTDSLARTDADVCIPEGGTPLQGPLDQSCAGQYV